MKSCLNKTMTELAKLRLDKWLWAARFFKTRSLAKQAIDGGKVHLDGQRVKVSKEISVGDKLTIRQGWDDKAVSVLQLSAQRRGGDEARALYRESDDSIERREQAAAARKAAGDMLHRPEHRPTKKQRRQIHRFKQDI
jgi:ribosome-associated heat shock protein Hsp15